MVYEDLPIVQIIRIKDLKNTCATIGEWKTAMSALAIELNISESDILKANRLYHGN